MTETRNVRSSLRGVVTSCAASKTITVKIERLVRHPKYGKYMRTHSKVHAHDEGSEARVGDTVDVMACRPLSKTKRWRLVSIVTRPETEEFQS